MSDSPMLDITTSESSVVVDADGNQHSSSSSSVAVPSQAIPDRISPTVSSLRTSQPRRSFSFRPQPIPALTPVQVNSIVKAQDLVRNVDAASREHTQPEDMRERSPANISSSYNLPKPVFLEAVLEDNSEDVTAHQKQSNDSHISDRQSAIYKETNVILEKLLALKNDKNSIHIPEMDAYHKAFEEFERIEKDLSHYKKASGSSATPRHLAYGSNDNDTRKSHLVLGWDRNSDKDAATSANKSNHDSPVPVTLPTTREGNAQPHIAKKLVAGSHDNIGRKTITLPLQFKRRKADSDESQPQPEQSCDERHPTRFFGIDESYPETKENGPDIVLNGTGTSPEEVVEYESGGPTPLVNPMRPDWRSLKSRWNLDLAEAFYIQFCKDAKNPKEYEFSKNDILVAFKNKLKYLCAYVNKAVPLKDESLDRTRERLNASLKHRRDISRPTQQSSYESIWGGGREGISSDESDAEGGPYIVKRRTWRSEELTQLLNITDSSYDWKNIYGNPHVLEIGHMATAVRKGHPFEDFRSISTIDDWYQLLTDIEKQLLRPEPEMALPAFTED
ncbi:hypothetical protein F5146DRAFT_999178 [Armillaria mellea]|nr:hypothetical protein F5146DRAFT_999178 [Armillaria mellea]